MVNYVNHDLPFVEPASLWSGAGMPDLPIGFVDLGGLGEWPDEIVLPPWPVVGIGSADHPFAAMLDAVIEAPVTPGQLRDNVAATPLAAATVAQLLRLLPSLPPEHGLTAESLAYATLQGSAEHLRWRARLPRSLSPPGTGAVTMQREGDRLMVTLANPAAGNAIDRPMRDALYEALSLATIDPEITAVSLRSTGKVFSLGAELSEFGTTTDPATAHAIRAQTLPAWQALRCADKLDVHVQGACVGAGLELAAFASRITASPTAWFQLPELAMGILPGAGGCVSLTRRIGRQRTALLILSGKRLSARKALEWGLVDALVEEPA